ncbi:helicase [candidate division KSB1 bacterium]|nr:helicase [candidate division KSB1 bacterium]
MEFTTGSLVRLRHRDWVVQPSPDEDLLLLKPLGGGENELTGVYLPLRFPEDDIRSTEFPLPGMQDIGDIASARLLFNAARLSIRDGSGPFRCLGKLSFRPRSYQMVPLIMALRQPHPMRMLIADDVGVGKTIEGLLILKELLERREIKRFAVIVLPHLCDQWQTELRDKFGIDAVVIRSNTQARLDREIFGDTSVFEYYPYQVISIDYIKSDLRRAVFINECPELIVVDEAHTCSHPGGDGSTGQQQRHALIRDIAAKPGQHVLLLTATPHSGKQEQFQSLLGLLNPSFSQLDIPQATPKERKQLAQCFVQRRRKDVEKWMNEDTPFPKRDSGEYAYDLSDAYGEFYDQVFDFAMGLTREEDFHQGRKRMRYWSALALLRGVMSSPAAGVSMLANRMAKREEENIGIDDRDNPILDEDNDLEKDFPSSGVISKTDFSGGEMRKLSHLSAQLQTLTSLSADNKAASALLVLREWLQRGFQPIVFCRYIATANYLGKVLRPELRDIKDLNLQVITSEDPDEMRKERIDDMATSKKRLLIATDCLSEGINLQDHFTAVLHYDLPWNPNRLEQREGRIDRFGQAAPLVKCYMLYGKDNPIDGVVLKVLLEKVRQIRQDIGISIPFPEDSKTLMDSVLQAVILHGRMRMRDKQTSFTFIDQVHEQYKELEISKAIEKAAEREKRSRSIFAQHSIKDSEIETDLRQSDEAIGRPQDVERFVTQALRTIIGAQITAEKEGYTLYTLNLPPALKSVLPDAKKIKVGFYSPVADGYYYIGRNHAFVEQLCRTLLALAMEKNAKDGPARAAVIRCRNVETKTVLLLFRVRNVIEEKGSGTRLVAEEVLPFGYVGEAEKFQLLHKKRVDELMFYAVPTANITDYAARDFLEAELNDIKRIPDQLNEVAFTRAEALVDAHERYRKMMGSGRYKVVQPVLPMDLLGVYILLPDSANG